MSVDVRGLVQRFALLSALRWFPVGLYLPVAILLMQARGLDLATIGGLYAIYGVVTVGLELPTGGLADVVGRRAVLVTAALATTLSLAIAAVAHDVPTFAIGMVVGAVGRALGSGPLDAWFVDAVHAVDPEASVRHGLSRAQSAEALALGLGAILGGFTPAIVSAIWPALPDSGSSLLVSLSVPALLAAGMMAAYGVVAAVVVREGRRARIGVGALVRGVPSTVRSGLTLGLGDRVLRRLMLRSVLIGIVLSGVELLSPGTFATLLGGEERASGAYGLLTAAAFAASAGGAALAPVVAIRLGGGARAARLVSWLAAPAATLLAVPLLAAAGMGYVGIYLLLGIVGPLTSELLHDRVGSSERATMLSMESLTLQAGGVLSNLLIGALVTATSTAAGFGVVALALLGSGVVLLGIRDAARGNVTASDLSDGSAPETVGSADRMGTAGAA